MNNNMTKERLNDHLSYDWWKYIAILIACIFFWSLVFTMASPRLAISKNMELFFVVDGFEAGATDNFRKELKSYLSNEIIEININNYIPNEPVTAQVLSARIYAGEGDLFALKFSEEPQNNSFASYVDNGLFMDLNTVIAKAIEFSDDIVSKDLFFASNPKIKADKIDKEYELYLKRKTDAKNHADKLAVYMDTESHLFYNYKKFTILNTPEQYPIQEEKVWGLNLGLLNGLFDDEKGFIYRRIDSEGKIVDFNFCMGIAKFIEANSPLFFENIAVLNFLIETYYLPYK